MVLEVGGEVVTQTADEYAIAAAIRSLAQQSEDEAFAILSSSDETYIQTLRAEDGTFGLEYQAGSTDQHFGCYDSRLDEAKVIRAFTFYLQGDLRWFGEWNWEKIEI